jgi:secretion/DNA translocation related TadE-like protein
MVRTDRGGVTVWMVLVVGLVGVVGLAVVAMGGGAARSGRAQAVADLAALAAVDGGRTAAEAVAEANGARMVRCRCDGRPVRVEVEWGGRRADAAASCPGCGAASP